MTAQCGGGGSSDGGGGGGDGGEDGNGDDDAECKTYEFGKKRSNTLIPRIVPVMIFPKSRQNRPKRMEYRNERSAHNIHQNDSAFTDERNAIENHVISIKSNFGLLNDGEISPSAYDTAWISLIEDVNGLSDGPQFPSSLEWIMKHQLSDGSWGDPLFFSAFDRLLNTLACVVALTTWNIHPDKCDKGMKFVEENINKLGDEKEEHMTQGFEVLFPSLIDQAQNLEIKFPIDSPILKVIYARRDVKLSKIPKDRFHKTPTILLYILEGLKDLEWEKLLKLQSENGSFLYSPAATAFAFMRTKDKKSLAYLTNLVDKFNGGVPHLYPVDMFEQLWMVDRLQRLGIARYFYHEIKDCTDYVYRYWNKEGLGFTRNCNFPDIDETAMAFRILRNNGYQISPDVFRYFEKEGKFVCYHGQSAEAVTVMFNLFRASQVLFPKETILNDAKRFSYEFLTEKRSTDKLLDKWVIAKDLPGEVGYALDVPWYASLPRLEARYYLEQYGGENDVWIGKSLYRLRNISNHTYLEMAKLDYNYCQAIHQLEWSHMQKWYADLNIEDGSKTELLWSYYEAAASIFEPEKCNERLAWAKTTVILHIITSFSRPPFSNRNFTSETIANNINRKPWQVAMHALHETINQISSNTHAVHGVDINQDLHHAWNAWLLNWIKGGDNIVEGEAELIVRTIYMSSGRWSSDETLCHPRYQRISSILSDIYHQIYYKEDHTRGFDIECKMQELVELVLCDSPDDLDFNLKQTFLAVAKTFYYRAFFDHETINRHVRKVLFEDVI